MPKINVNSSYFNHPKVRRLKVWCGLEADIFPIRLWSFCSEYFPKDGVFKGYLGSEIERIAGWNGVTGNLIHYLEEYGFLDKNGEEYRIHDWQEHAGFIWNYSQAGRKAGKKSGESRRYKRQTVERIVNDRSTIELNGIELNKDLPPAAKSKPVDKSETGIQQVVRTWKELAGIPVEGPESSKWDQVHFPRHAKAAKSLLTLFGDPSATSAALRYVYGVVASWKLPFGIEAVVKHSDLYRAKRSESKRMRRCSFCPNMVSWEAPSSTCDECRRAMRPAPAVS